MKDTDMHNGATASVHWLTRLTRRTKGFPIIPVVILGGFVIAAVFAPWVAPYSPYEGSLRDSLIPPVWASGGSWAHVLGTDQIGRDMLSQIIFGARASLLVAVTAIILSGSVGTVLGIVSGYFGGWVDIIIMRTVDMMLSLPIFLIAMILVVVLGSGKGYENIIVVVALVLWARYARQVRAEVLAVRDRPYVRLAQTAGCSHISIIVRHIFPNVMNTLVILASLQLGYIILMEASLSFLGAGIPPPTPAWGLLVAAGRNLVTKAWWISTMPGVAILLIVMAGNFLGDWLRDKLDPRLRQL